MGTASMTGKSREEFLVLFSRTMANQLLSDDGQIWKFVSIEDRLAQVYTASCILLDGLLSVDRAKIKDHDCLKIASCLDELLPGGMTVMEDLKKYQAECEELQIELIMSSGEDVGRRFPITAYLYGKLGISEEGLGVKDFDSFLNESYYPDIEKMFRELYSDGGEHKVVCVNKGTMGCP